MIVEKDAGSSLNQGIFARLILEVILVLFCSLHLLLYNSCCILTDFVPLLRYLLTCDVDLIPSFLFLLFVLYSTGKGEKFS